MLDVRAEGSAEGCCASVGSHELYTGVYEGCEGDEKAELGCFIRFAKVGRCGEVTARRWLCMHDVRGRCVLRRRCRTTGGVWRSSQGCDGAEQEVSSAVCEQEEVSA